MLQFMRLQRVQHDRVAEHQQQSDLSCAETQHILAILDKNAGAYN